MNCPGSHGEMKKIKGLENIVFRGKELQVLAEHYRCPECGITIDDLPLASRNQKALADAYRKSADMLTSDEIAAERRKKGWTQEQLAQAMNVGIASIKRWEKGQIQTRPMDDALKRAFRGEAQECNPFFGNRELSLERIKLVLDAFSAKLGRRLLKAGKGDRLLYAAKYLWYADMVSYRELGQSMTGGTYARLPKGPQLNNYNDLAPLIQEADESIAEPLTEHEERIIGKIAAAFPTNQAVYMASHYESVWSSRKNGVLFPYTDAEKLTGI